jgi:hypothetical protein
MTTVETKSGPVEIAKGLPEGVDALSEAQWLELMNSNDALKRKSAGEVLKKLGYEPTQYIKWEKEQRAAVLAAHGEFGKGANGKGASAAAAGKGAAKTATTNKTSGSGGADLGLLTARIEVLETQNAELLAFIKDMHVLVRVLVQSDAQLQENAQDIGPDLYGELAYGEFAGGAAEGNAEA